MRITEERGKLLFQDSEEFIKLSYNKHKKTVETLVSIVISITYLFALTFILIAFFLYKRTEPKTIKMIYVTISILVLLLLFLAISVIYFQFRSWKLSQWNPIKVYSKGILFPEGLFIDYKRIIRYQITKQKDSSIKNGELKLLKIILDDNSHLILYNVPTCFYQGGTEQFDKLVKVIRKKIRQK